MNRYILGLLLLVGATAGTVFLLATRQPEEIKIVTSAHPETHTRLEPASEPITESADAKISELQKKEPASAIPKEVTAPKPPSSRYAHIVIPAGQPVPELFPHQKEREAVYELASTYDAKNVPAIATYLSHQDSTVRAAARQSLVQIGDEKAIPYLKEAADKATDPEEKRGLQESAEFLALPSFVDVIFPHLAAQKKS